MKYKNVHKTGCERCGNFRALNKRKGNYHYEFVCDQCLEELDGRLVKDE